MAVGFKLIQSDGRVVDIDDLLVRRDLFSDGSAFRWGGPVAGGTAASSPTQVSGGGITWKQIAAGNDAVFGIKNNGTLWVFGSAYVGGSGTPTPIQVEGGGTNWKQVAANSYNQTVAAAIKTDGTLWTWGDNLYSTHSLGDAYNYFTGASTGHTSPSTIYSGGTNWKYVTGKGQYFLALKTDNTLWAWGLNGYGCLGIGNTTAQYDPVQVAGGGTWKQVSADFYASAGVKTDGSVWAWGINTGTSSPVQLTSGNDWKQISSIAGVVYAGIKTNGTLWTWGTNSLGELGTNAAGNRTTPGTTAGGGTNWKSVDISSNSTVSAIKTDGTLWTWGNDGGSGMLGDGYFSIGVGRSSPAQTAGAGTNWKQCITSYTMMAALKDLTI